jgi:hypothetical protein
MSSGFKLDWERRGLGEGPVIAHTRMAREARTGQIDEKRRYIFSSPRPLRSRREIGF